LGDLTDEILEYGEGSKIIEFVSSGPKSYSYKVAVKGDITNIKIVTKVKGFRLHAESERLLTFDMLQKQVNNHDERVTVRYSSDITRTFAFQVLTRSIEKTHRFTYKKRILDSNFKTLPYGYCK